MCDTFEYDVSEDGTDWNATSRAYVNVAQNYKPNAGIAHAAEFDGAGGLAACSCAWVFIRWRWLRIS